MLELDDESKIIEKTIIVIKEICFWLQSANCPSVQPRRHIT